MCTFGVSDCRVRAPAARSGGATGVSHDNPRAQTRQPESPNMHILGSTKRPAETPKVGISRVSILASLAFGQRRLHTITDYIDCPTLSFHFF